MLEKIHVDAWIRLVSTSKNIFATYLKVVASFANEVFPWVKPAEPVAAGGGWRPVQQVTGVGRSWHHLCF